MTKRIIRLPQVKERTGLSRSSIYAFMKENKFPHSFNLSDDGRAKGWLEESIEEWVSSKAKNVEEVC
jgi:prophage regulatory protein